MPSGVVPKKVDEKYPLAVDYTDILNDSETISSLTVTISPYNTTPHLNLTGVPIIDNDVFQAGQGVQEGVKGQMYRMKFLMTTDAARVFVDYLYVRVIE